MSGTISLFPYTEDVPEGMVWTYQVVLRGGNVTHLWSLADKTGGIHISANISSWSDGSRQWLGGCETHYAKCPDYMSPNKPSCEHCWVLGGPCWHDGSSLYFSENVAPFLPNPWEGEPHNMRPRHHEAVTFELRYLHRLRFTEDETSE